MSSFFNKLKTTALDAGKTLSQAPSNAKNYSIDQLTDHVMKLAKPVSEIMNNDRNYDSGIEKKDAIKKLVEKHLNETVSSAFSTASTNTKAEVKRHVEILSTKLHSLYQQIKDKMNDIDSKVTNGQKPVEIVKDQLKSILKEYFDDLKEYNDEKEQLLNGYSSSSAPSSDEYDPFNSQPMSQADVSSIIASGKGGSKSRKSRKSKKNKKSKKSKKSRKNKKSKKSKKNKRNR